MERRLYIITLVVSILLAGCSETLATTAVIPGDDEMVIESRAIVTGRVIGLSTGVDLSTGFVYTYIRVEVNAVLKGQITEYEIVLKELGGETEDHGTLIFGMPRFEREQEVLLYLNTWPDGSLRVHQGFLGKFNINRDSSTGSLSVERQIEGEDVLIMSGSANNGTNRSELDAYTQIIARLMETNRKKMREFERKYYSDVPMLTQPIGFDPSRPSPEINPQFAFLNPSNPARWFEPDADQPVVFYVNPTGAPGFADLQADMQAAMNAWSTAGGSIRLTFGGLTDGCGVYVADGVNTISFNNCDGYFSPSQGCAGLIAVSGIVNYVPDETKSVGGISYCKAIEANMSFNPYGLCNYRNRSQLQEIATHEIGHALGLGHSSEPNATMAPYVHFDNRGASLMPDDIQGAVAIYPAGPNGTQLSIVTSTLPTAGKDCDYSANLEASGGTGGYHWNLVSGHLPPGMQLAMSGFLFGKTNSSGNFDFIAQVRDWSGNMSQGSFRLEVRGPAPVPPPIPVPAITNAEYKKKRVSITGANFQPGASVYIDGEGVSATFEETRLITEKRKQKVGVHQVSVVNPDGRQSNTFLLVIE